MAKKNCPTHVSQKKGGLTDDLAQNGGIPSGPVLSSFRGTAGCPMAFSSDGDKKTWL